MHLNPWLCLNLNKLDYPYRQSGNLKLIENRGFPTLGHPGLTLGMMVDFSNGFSAAPFAPNRITI